MSTEEQALEEGEANGERQPKSDDSDDDEELGDEQSETHAHRKNAVRAKSKAADLDEPNLNGIKFSDLKRPGFRGFISRIVRRASSFQLLNTVCNQVASVPFEMLMIAAVLVNASALASSNYYLTRFVCASSPACRSESSRSDQEYALWVVNLTLTCLFFVEMASLASVTISLSFSS